MKNVLVVGAHYDDAELGVGGTMARLVAEGKNVYKLTLTDNVTKSSHLHINVEYETSAKASAEACKVLGVKEISEFKPINCCQLFYDTDIMQRVENIIYKYNIDTVFMHYIDDLNQDHISAAKICLTASRHCANVLFYQSNLYIFPRAFVPTVYFDISEHIEKKKEALSKYTGDHNRFNSLFETNMERNHIWGYSNKCAYAEGFVPQKFLL